MAKRTSAKPKRSRHYDEPGAYARRMAKRAESEARDAEAEQPRVGSRWWALEGEAATQAAIGWVERLKAQHKRRSLMDALWEAVYKDTPLNAALDAAATLLRTQQARQNIVMSMVDTLRARIGKRRPMPVISADDAGPSEKLFAKRASRVLRRKMGRSDVERMCPLVVRDGLIRGTGVSKVYRDGGDVAVERVPRRELFMDPVDAQYGTPRVMAQVKRIDRDVLRAMYPERATDIDAASRASRDEWRIYSDDSGTDSEQVEVFELWHLPSCPPVDDEDTDGRHLICIRGYEPLLDEEWRRVRFPFAFFQWNEAMDGFWGTGLVEHAAPIQQEINAMLKDMGEGISLGMQLKVFLPKSSNVNKNHLRARNPAVIEHDGAQPQYVAPLPFNPAVLNYLQWRIQQAYEMAGVSQASAGSKNPLGSNASGKALDTMYDLESDRFSHVELQYAMYRVDLGSLILDEARAIAADEACERKAPWISELEWKRIDVDSGTFRLVLEPINFLPDTRAGKLSHVKELADAGLLQSPMQTAALFDEPDIARANRYLVGPYRMLERWCEDIADPDIALEDLAPGALHAAYIDQAKEMLKGELANQMAESGMPPTPEDEVIQERFRAILKLLEGAAGGVGPAPAVPGPAPMMPGDPMAAGAPPMPMPPAAPGLDPMGGLTSQLAAGMPVPPGVMQ